MPKYALSRGKFLTIDGLEAVVFVFCPEDRAEHIVHALNAYGDADPLPIDETSLYRLCPGYGIAKGDSALTYVVNLNARDGDQPVLTYTGFYDLLQRIAAALNALGV